MTADRPAVPQDARKLELRVTVRRHKNRRWDLYMTHPDGSTETWRSVLDVRNIDGFIWRRLREMEDAP